MDFDRIARKQKKGLEVNSEFAKLKEQENILYDKLDNLQQEYMNNVDISNKKIFMRNELFDEFSQYFKNKGYEVECLTLESKASIGDFSLTLKLVDDDEYKIIISSDGKKQSFILHLVEKEKFYLKHHGVREQNGNMRYIGTAYTEKELNTPLFVQKEIGWLKADIDMYENLIKNAKNIEFVYEYDNDCNINGRFNNVKEILMALPD